MRIALAQVNPTIGDFAGNFRLINEAIDRAKAAGCDLAVFPELATTGYPPRDLLEERWFVQQNLDGLKRLIRRRAASPSPWATSRRRRAPRPPAPQLRPPVRGRSGAARARKMLLPTYDVFDEDALLRAGPPGDAVVCAASRSA